MKQLSKEAMASVSGGKVETHTAMAPGTGGTDGGGGMEVSRTELGALAAGLGGGVGASFAIEATGGFGAVGTMGTAAVGLLTAAGTGLAAAAGTGALIGDYAYHHSETVQEYSQAAVGYVVETARDISGRMSFDLQREYGDTIGDTACTAEWNGK